jgi:hypothetical protein
VSDIKPRLDVEEDECCEMEDEKKWITGNPIADACAKSLVEQKGLDGACGF